MSRELFISTVAAAALHVGALFGLRLGTSAVALPMGDQSNIEVSLVAEVPAEAVAAPNEPSLPPEPPPPQPEPEMNQPPPPDLAPSAEPERETPSPPAPEPKPARRVSKPSAAATRPNVTRQASGASTGSRSSPTGGTMMARPRYRSNPPPVYPPEARRQRQEGTAILEVQVNEEGRAGSIAVQRSSGFSALDEAALSAVRQWTFVPGRVGGLTVSSRVQIPVRFRLRE